MRTAMIAAACTAVLVAAVAQAQSDQDLEPRVQTSKVLPPSPATSSAAAATEGAAGPATAPPVTAASSPPSQPRASSEQTASASADAAAPTAVRSADSLQLGTTEISGNRELPKLMYIVPWRRPEIGPYAGRPPNSLVEEALTPVDRAVFERQNRYYAALQASASSPVSTPAAARAPGEPPAKAAALPAGAGGPAGTGQLPAARTASGRDEK